MSRLLRVTAVAALATAALLPATASACHEVVAPIEVGPVYFAGIYIPC